MSIEQLNIKLGFFEFDKDWQSDLAAQAAYIELAASGPQRWCRLLADIRIWIDRWAELVSAALSPQPPPGTRPPTTSWFLSWSPVRLDGSSIGSLGPRGLSDAELPVPIHLPPSDEVVRVARQSRGRDRRLERHLSIEDYPISGRGQLGHDLPTAAARAAVASCRVRGRDIENPRLHRRGERFNEVRGVVVDPRHSRSPFRSSLRNSL